MKDLKNTPAYATRGSSLLARSVRPSLTNCKTKSPFQLSTLERSYAASKYPSPTRRLELSVQLGLTDLQVQSWFRHRRHKDVENMLFLRRRSMPSDTKVKTEAEQEQENEDTSGDEGDEGKHPEPEPEPVSQSEQLSGSSIFTNIENHNARIQTILKEVSSLCKEQETNYTEFQESVAALNKQKEEDKETIRDWMDAFEEENALRREVEKELLEERSAKEKEKRAAQCWKGAFEEEEKTAKRWKGAFEEEKYLREKAEKKLVHERSAWADLAVQLAKAKKQNEDIFNTVSERCGTTPQTTGISGVGSSTSRTTSSG